MEIKVYNTKIGTSYAFEPWEYAKNQFDLNDYDLVGEGNIKFGESLNRNAQLEALFATLNGRRMGTDTIDVSNFKYHGHSLSTSDIVYFVDKDEYYYVDAIGFVKIQVEITEEMVSDLIVYGILNLREYFNRLLRPRYHVDKEDIVNYLQFLGQEPILDKDNKIRLPYVLNSKEQK